MSHNLAPDGRRSEGKLWPSQGCCFPPAASVRSLSLTVRIVLSQSENGEKPTVFGQFVQENSHETIQTDRKRSAILVDLRDSTREITGVISGGLKTYDPSGAPQAIGGT